ncbi:MAG: uracil-DNA glycosylase [Pseudomonadota bacterium]
MTATINQAPEPPSAPPEPPVRCGRCPRLAAYRGENIARYPHWFNGAAPSAGDAAAPLLIVGLAPGLRGANRTGRPFTGDASGALLTATLIKFGFAAARDGEDAALREVMITNAVRCAPPGNKPTAAEITACRPHLAARINAMPRLKAILCLGRVAHDSTLRVFGRKLASAPFSHGARHAIGPLMLFDSYHCSRYNTQTGRLTPLMFETLFAEIKTLLDAAARDTARRHGACVASTGGVRSERGAIRGSQA